MKKCKTRIRCDERERFPLNYVAECLDFDGVGISYEDVQDYP